MLLRYPEYKNNAKGIPRVSNGEEVEFYVPLLPIDWKVVRRRLEDRLRRDEEFLKKQLDSTSIE